MYVNIHNFIGNVKKGIKMKKIINFIMKLLGGIDVNQIIIPKIFKVPGKEKLRLKIDFYLKNNYFEDNIIIDENNVLIDGFTTYYICKLYGFRYIGVTRVKLKNI